MVNQRTPSQHNSTLFILPHIATRRQLFKTPPNPSTKLLDSPGSHSFFLEKSVTGEGNDSDPLTLVERLRLWRHDALMQHQYQTAAFVGDKVLSLTHDANDAFWLAQVYYNSGQYLRAKELILGKPEYEKSVTCRYLAARSAIKLELWDEALDLVGENNPFSDRSDRARGERAILSDNKRTEQPPKEVGDGGIKLEASMCYLRGMIYANQNNFERAKECYKEALVVDVKCYEAFNELVSNSMMLPAEEWDFVQNLRYDDDLIRLLYCSRLSKYVNRTRYEEADAILNQEYELHDNNDLLVNRAHYLYVLCNFDECLQVCEKVLAQDHLNFEVLPLYFSCLYEIGGKNKLFLKAHQLADTHPTDPVTWLAIGTYYLLVNNLPEARKFFSKATLLDPNQGYAWIGFGHTFAADGEHEQAMSAYAFAARLYPGTHLPHLFLGMQHFLMNNFSLAQEYLQSLYQICASDPLLLNELGVVCFHRNNLSRAQAYFEEALAAAKHLNSDSKAWISIHTNLGHTFRRSKQLEKALECFQQVLRLSHKDDASILAAVGLVHLKLGNASMAVESLHDSLAISPSDPIANDLLKRALELSRDSFTSVPAPGIPKTRRQDENQDVGALAESLKRGEDSSEDEEMEMESD